MSNIPEDPIEDPAPTVEERLRAAFPGLGEPKPQRFHPQWIVDWNLDLVDRMMRGELISREEVDALAIAMGQQPIDPDEARRIMEEVFGKSAMQMILDLQNRNN